MTYTFQQFRENFTLAADPAVWMKAQTKMKPDPWQAAVLRSTASRLYLCCSRQSGKSQTTSILAAHTALFQKDQLILVLSPSQRQSSELFKKIKAVLRGVETNSFEAETALTCELNNGSRIISLPGNPSTVRTYAADVVVIDEASRTVDTLYRAVRPMLATKPNGKLLLLSTPAARSGYFWEIHKGDDPDWERYNIPADQCPRISAKFLEQERKSLPKYIFEREYFCKFPQEEESYFMENDILDCFVDKAPFILRGLEKNDE